MNAERLLQHFDRISEAPEAIPRLRRFILDLAVRGKLVEQDPSDEPAAELLKRIGAEKVQLVKEGKIRKEKSLPAITASDSSFDLPQSWQWVRLGSLSLMTTSGSRDWAQHYSDQGAIFVRMGNLSRDSYILRLDNIQRVCPPENGEGTRTKLEAGDILISITGEVGLLGLIPPNFGDAYINQHTCMVRLASFIRDRFIPEVLRAPFVQNQFNAPQRGIKNSFRLTDVTEMLIPLPPLAEQHRIVAKVDELMALCDQLEAAKTEREQSRDRLVAASLHCLHSPADTAETDAPDLSARQADACRDHACFVFHHLPRLTTRPEHIKQLRQTILNLAVRGKLVPQDPNDELVTEPFNSIGRDEAESAPFSLPDAWKWAKVQEIANTRLGKMLDQAKNKGTERRYLRNVNVRWFDFELSDVLTMRFEDSELKEFSLRVGDVLICEGGEPGRAAVWDGRENNIYFQKAIHRVRFAQGVNPHYFVYVIKESADSGRLAGYFTGVGIKHFTGKGLSSLLVSLPPLAEQHRIVARVDELMALCDQLEAQLTTAEADSHRLLEAVLHEALNPLVERTEWP